VRYHELPLESAVFVIGIEPGSPAAQGGVREGDLIVAFDGTPVGGVDDLHRRLTQEEADRETAMVVLRGSERHTLTVKPTLRT
jgi:S1-C subfamily serine protease